MLESKLFNSCVLNIQDIALSSIFLEKGRKAGRESKRNPWKKKEGGDSNPDRYSSSCSYPYNTHIIQLSLQKSSNGIHTIDSVFRDEESSVKTEKNIHHLNGSDRLEIPFHLTSKTWFFHYDFP